MAPDATIRSGRDPTPGLSGPGDTRREEPPEE